MHLWTNSFALLRRVIRLLKKQLIAANLTFTDREATKFRASIRSILHRTLKTNDTRTALIKEYGDVYGSLTVEQADSLIGGRLDMALWHRNSAENAFHSQSVGRKEYP
jgi:hypothetical protein